MLLTPTKFFPGSKNFASEGREIGEGGCDMCTGSVVYGLKFHLKYYWPSFGNLFSS